MKRISDRERRYLDELLREDLSNRKSGTFLRRLEACFAQTFGARYAIAMCNGTATLHTALAAAGIGPGDEVILPPLTMMSTTFAVLHAGAMPVYADVDPFTWTLSAGDVARKLTRKTKAILTVSLYGCPPDMDDLHQVARSARIPLIEDNAQAVLAIYRNKVLGSQSTMACFSFQNSKALSAGEGGMLITSDRALAQKARRFAGLGFRYLSAESPVKSKNQRLKENPDFERHTSLGWNYAMSEFSAAVALGQTERAAELVSARRKAAALYRAAHDGCSWLIPQGVPQDAKHAYWTYPLLIAPQAPVDWRQFHRAFIKAGGEGVYSAWQLSYLEPVLKGKTFGKQTFKRGLCPIAEFLQPRLLQFKTNAMNLAHAQSQADALRRAIAMCSKS